MAQPRQNDAGNVPPSRPDVNTPKTEVQKRRLVRARAPRFFSGLAHRLWVGRGVFAPGFTPLEKYQPGQSRYRLAHDVTACEWVETWLSAFVAEMDDTLRQAPIRASAMRKRRAVMSTSERKYQKLVARSVPRLGSARDEPGRD